ncbi:MAG: glycosyl hydrolase family 17 protein [Planctomycetota bacterium]
MQHVCALFVLAACLVPAVSEAQADDRRPFATHLDGTWIGGGICYGPFRDGQAPGASSPSEEELLEDLELMSERWSLFRMYSSRGSAEIVCRLLVEHDIPMRIMVGAWIGSEHAINPDGSFGDPIPGTAAENRAEIEMAIHLANTYPSVVHSISVGNETQMDWSGHRARRDVLIGYIRTAREATSVPVTTCDDFNFWNKPESKEVAAECDFIGWHAYAMWNSQTLTDALSWTREKLAECRAMHPDMLIVHAETGWTTSVDPNATPEGGLIIGQPGEREQELFFRSYTSWADELGLPYFYFSAFDEAWKGGDSPSEAEKHWGVYFSDRSPKLAVQAPAER